MYTQAIVWDNDLKPAITLNDLFIYAGHTMTLGIFTDETSNDISWSVASTWATPIEGGVYPANFAELEACEIIEALLEPDSREIHDPATDAYLAVMSAVTRALVANDFSEVR